MEHFAKEKVDLDDLLVGQGYPKVTCLACHYVVPSTRLGHEVMPFRHQPAPEA